MKKAIACAGIMLAVLGMGLLAGGCDSAGGAAAVSQDDLIGRWEFTTLKMHSHYEITVNGKTNSTNTDTTQSLADQGNFLQLNQDLAFSANIPIELFGLMGKTSAAQAGFPVTGTWSVAGSVVTLVSTDKKDTLAFGASVSGSKGSFTLSDESSGVEGGYSYKSTMTGTIESTKAAVK
jgi:hypothetical protein